MSFLDVLIHIGNFFLPAMGLGMIAALFTKLAWPRRLAKVSWLRLAIAASLASMAALVLGLIMLGRDGKMLTYSAMVLASACALWLTGLRG
jgi:hypothetical protein